MNRLSLIWVTLLALTLVSWLLGQRLDGVWLPVVVLGLAVIKGQLVIDDFMELKEAPRLLRQIVSGWLVTVLVIAGGVGWLT